MVAKVAPDGQQKEIAGDAERVAEPLSRYAVQLMEQLANRFPGMEVAVDRGRDERLRSCGSGR